MEKEKTFNDICFEFQQTLIDVFNKEEDIPFLLKYYLMKEVWDSVQKNKMTIDKETRDNYLSSLEQMKEQISTETE